MLQSRVEQLDLLIAEFIELNPFQLTVEVITSIMDNKPVIRRDKGHAMLSHETEGLFDLQKQVRRQIVEMCQKSVPLSLPDAVGAKLNTICQNALNETGQKMKEIQTEYLRDIQKHTEKFLADLSTNTGVWLSQKVFWWSAGIAYVLSLLGFFIIIWNLAH